jgi:hypothetical protein
MEECPAQATVTRRTPGHVGWFGAQDDVVVSRTKANPESLAHHSPSPLKLALFPDALVALTPGPTLPTTEKF